MLNTFSVSQVRISEKGVQTHTHIHTQRGFRRKVIKFWVKQNKTQQTPQKYKNSVIAGYAIILHYRKSYFLLGQWK